MAEQALILHFPVSQPKVDNVQHNDVIQSFEGGRLVVEFADDKSEKNWRQLPVFKWQR